MPSEVAAASALLNLAVLQAAGEHGADMGALLDSSAFLGKLSTLDPADPGYAQAVNAAVASSVQEQPARYAAAPPPGQVEPERSPADDPDRQWTEDDVKGATPEEFAAAKAAGRMTDLGVGPDSLDVRHRQHKGFEEIRRGELEALHGRNRGRREFEERQRELAEQPIVRREWTDEAIAAATPSEVAAAMSRGELAGLGVPGRTRRGDHRPVRAVPLDPA